MCMQRHVCVRIPVHVDVNVNVPAGTPGKASTIRPPAPLPAMENSTVEERCVNWLLLPGFVLYRLFRIVR